MFHAGANAIGSKRSRHAAFIFALSGGHVCARCRGNITFNGLVHGEHKRQCQKRNEVQAPPGSRHGAVDNTKKLIDDPLGTVPHVEEERRGLIRLRVAISRRDMYRFLWGERRIAL